MCILRPVPPVFTDEMSAIECAKNYKLWDNRRDVLIRVQRRYQALFDDMQQIYYEDTGKPGGEVLVGHLAATGIQLLKELASVQEYLEHAQEQCKAYGLANRKLAGFTRRAEQLNR